MRPADSITALKGIGPRRAELFGRLGLYSIDDLIHFSPRTYRDYSKARLILQCEDGEDVCLRLSITGEAKVARIRRGLTITSVQGADESGLITLQWFNQPFRKDAVRAGETIYACGTVSRKRGLKLISPTLCRELPGIVPVYRVTKGLSSAVISAAINEALRRIGEFPETLPGVIRDKYALCHADAAIRETHAPHDMEALAAARRRTLFDELLTLSLMLAMHRRNEAKKAGLAFDTNHLLNEFLKLLPYAPTGAQLRALRDIEADMAKAVPMNRLIQGDVGSGKTVLALFAMFVANKNGLQSALMAPTEILAAQHYITAQSVLGANVALLTGSMGKREREAVRARLAGGEPLALIGTHALLYEDDPAFCPAVVIADEQHRFGVSQRARISEKGEALNAASADAVPDMLIMSATPIPRTLSLILYGDLDVSMLDELPPGRKPIKTRIVPPGKRDAMYGFIEEKAKQGLLSYVVCPLVEESEDMENVTSATELYRELSAKLCVPVGLLHGQMSAKEKDEVTRRFRCGEIGVLVSTTVIEVGVDVKNAVIMAVENAERFGLAQLHQLRGRVGRGSEESFCFLLCGENTKSGTANERLRTLVETQDGFKIAEKDLLLRGPGEFLGTRQHGETDYADVGTIDPSILMSVREAAEMLANGTVPADEAAPLLAAAREKLAQKTKDIALN